RGSIAPPEGAPPGWLPPGAEGVDENAADDEAPAPDAPADDAPPDAGAAADPHEAYATLVRMIDPHVDDATFEALWASGGADEATRAGAIDAFLWRTVGEAKP